MIVLYGTSLRSLLVISDRFSHWCQNTVVDTVSFHQTSEKPSAFPVALLLRPPSSSGNIIRRLRSFFKHLHDERGPPSRLLHSHRVWLWKILIRVAKRVTWQQWLETAHVAIHASSQKHVRPCSKLYIMTYSLIRYVYILPLSTDSSCPLQVQPLPTLHSPCQLNLRVQYKWK